MLNILLIYRGYLRSLIKDFEVCRPSSIIGMDLNCCFRKVLGFIIKFSICLIFYKYVQYIWMLALDVNVLYIFSIIHLTFVVDIIFSGEMLRVKSSVRMPTLSMVHIIIYYFKIIICIHLLRFLLF